MRSNYTRHILWDVITCLVPWYLLLAHDLIPVALSLVIQVYTFMSAQNLPFDSNQSLHHMYHYRKDVNSTCRFDDLAAVGLPSFVSGQLPTLQTHLVSDDITYITSALIGKNAHLWLDRRDMKYTYINCCFMHWYLSIYVFPCQSDEPSFHGCLSAPCPFPTLRPDDVYMRQAVSSLLVRVMAFRLLGA